MYDEDIIWNNIITIYSSKKQLNISIEKGGCSILGTISKIHIMCVHCKVRRVSNECWESIYRIV